MSIVGTRLAAIAATAAAALALAGCGDDTGEAEAALPTVSAESASGSALAATTPIAALPECGEIWRAGAQLPAEYRGCQRDGTAVTRHLRCETGQLLYTYDGAFFAIRGGRIGRAQGPLADDADFQRIRRICAA